MYPLMYVGLHVKCLLLLFNFNQAVFSRQILLYSLPPLQNFTKFSKAEPKFPLRTHWQTHKINEANSELRNFVNAPKKAMSLSLACSNFQNIKKKKLTLITLAALSWRCRYWSHKWRLEYRTRTDWATVFSRTNTTPWSKEINENCRFLCSKCWNSSMARKIVFL